MVKGQKDAPKRLIKKLGTRIGNEYLVRTKIKSVNNTIPINGGPG